jgi:hypothetical protein
MSRRILFRVRRELNRKQALPLETAIVAYSTS